MMTPGAPKMPEKWEVIGLWLLAMGMSLGAAYIFMVGLLSLLGFK
jgi:hypothetical protein